MIEDGKYVTPAITCEANHGVCHIEGKCSTCDYATKYEHIKKVYKLSTECEWRKGVICSKEKRECKTEECSVILNSLN